MSNISENQTENDLEVSLLQIESAPSLFNEG